ncbi:MAG: DUF481 domain-containing protein [Flavobacteriaceae bacterium]|nr:DUF481 domain-containing protein [Flavobacteriaceae bacterium]
MRIPIYPSIMAFLICFISNAQIENIEASRIWSGDSPWTFNSDLTFSYWNNDGNYNFLVGASSSVLFKFKDQKDRSNDKVGLRNKLLFIGNYSLLRAEDRDLDNNWFLHLRYNREFTDFFRVEAFIQSQENQLLLIDSRRLVGAGVRLKPLQERARNNNKRNSLHLYLGLAYMYEQEQSELFDLELFNHRASSYLTASFKFSQSGVTLTNTFYYQPLLKDFTNYRISQDLDMAFPINSVIRFIARFNYFLNSSSPAGDTEYRSSLLFGLRFRFQSKVSKSGVQIDPESIKKKRPKN